MKRYLLAAVVGSTILGAGGAFAQGLPAGTTPPEYGAVWSANQIKAERLAQAQKAEQARHAQGEAPAVPGQNRSAAGATDFGG